MKNLRQCYIIALLLLNFASLKAQGIKINEIMASNSSSISDEDGDQPDWVELFNAGDAEVNLSGYGLSDNSEEPFKWTFPNVTVKPGDFLLVYASDKDRKGSFSYLHTNFKISAEGEGIILTHPDGERVDEIAPQEIPTDFSFGRHPDGGEVLKFFTEPSPKSSNTGPAYGSFAPAPVFSQSGGFYEAAFELSITSPDPEVSIIYTVDGSVPDPANLSGTTFTYKNQYPQEPGSSSGSLLYGSYQSLSYSETIPIKDRSSDPDMVSRISSTYDSQAAYFPTYPGFKGTVVKAIAVKPDAVPSKVVANTYFITEQGRSRFSLPVVSISASPEALFGYEKGIYVAGQDFDNWRRNNSWGFPDGGTPANYQRSGSGWEVPAHIELFDGENGSVLSQGVGIRIHGGWTRAFPAKSLRLYARNEYGESHFNYPVFPDEPYDAYKRLVLRNSGNDFGFSMFRDAAIHAIVGHMNIETMAFRPAILFINSEYWGIHNFRERYDKHYFERKYSADPEALDILEVNMGVVEGDATHYRETIQYIESNGLRDEQHYQYIMGRIDIDNFIDYQIAQVYAGNADWPGNNIKYWRSKTASTDPSAPKEMDGRWRWLLYDTDFGFSLFNATGYTENTLRLATDPRGPHWPNPPWSTFLFRKLLENESFRNKFINRFSDQLNTAFKPAVVKNKITALQSVIEPEIEEHIVRWKAPHSTSAWERSIDNMLDFADLRPDIQRGHLKSYFRLEEDFELSVDVSHPDRGYVRVNSLALQEGTEGLGDNVYPWRGTYFKGVPVEVEAVPVQGFVFTGWQGYESTSSKILIEADADISLVALFREVVASVDKESKRGEKMEVYPNPADDETNVKIYIRERSQVKISVHDMAGKLQAVISEGVLSAGTHSFSIFTRHLPPGVYMIRSQFNNEQIHQKLVKY